MYGNRKAPKEITGGPVGHRYIDLDAYIWPDIILNDKMNIKGQKCGVATQGGMATL